MQSIVGFLVGLVIGGLGMYFWKTKGYKKDSK